MTSEGVRSSLAEANGYVAAAAPGGADLIFACSAGQVDVRTLSAPTQFDDFTSIVSFLEQSGLNQPNVHYSVFYNAHLSNAGIAGQGHVGSVSGGTFYALSYGYSQGWIILHEMTHNLGAVKMDAPFTTGAWHCRDGLDVMCYADGGPFQTQLSVCATQVYDCRGDTYANVAPPTGSYLSLHPGANVFSCLDRYIRVSACAPPPPPPPSYRLTVEIHGAGMVTGSVWCKRTCSKRFPEGKAIELRKTPAAGSVVYRWPGMCVKYHVNRFRIAADRRQAVHFRTSCAPLPPPPPPPPPPSIWDGRGIFAVASAPDVPAHTDWVAYQLASPWSDTVTPNRSLRACGWLWLSGDPAAEAELASRLLHKYDLSCFIANAEEPYKASAGGWEKSAAFVKRFRELEPAIPAALSTLCASPAPWVMDIDYATWRAAGFHLLPQVYQQSAPWCDWSVALDHAERAGYTRNLVHPTVGVYEGVPFTAYAGLPADFSVYRLETMTAADKANLASRP